MKLTRWRLLAFVVALILAIWQFGPSVLSIGSNDSPACTIDVPDGEYAVKRRVVRSGAIASYEVTSRRGTRYKPTNLGACSADDTIARAYTRMTFTVSGCTCTWGQRPRVASN